MFEVAEHRDETEYIRWEGREHPTMCYPGLKLFRYPKKFRVNKKTDKDLCDKNMKHNLDLLQEYSHLVVLVSTILH